MRTSSVFGLRSVRRRCFVAGPVAVVGAGLLRPGHVVARHPVASAISRGCRCVSSADTAPRRPPRAPRARLVDSGRSGSLFGFAITAAVIRSASSGQPGVCCRCRCCWCRTKVKQRQVRVSRSRRVRPPLPLRTSRCALVQLTGHGLDCRGARAVLRSVHTAHLRGSGRRRLRWLITLAPGAAPTDRDHRDGVGCRP